jgi:hypothetical protein
MAKTRAMPTDSTTYRAMCISFQTMLTWSEQTRRIMRQEPNPSTSRRGHNNTTQLQPEQMPSPTPTNLWHGLFINQAGTGEEKWTTLDDAQDNRSRKAGQGCVGETNPYNRSPPNPKRPPVVDKTCCMLGISATHAIFENPVTWSPASHLINAWERTKADTSYPNTYSNHEQTLQNSLQ